MPANIRSSGLTKEQIRSKILYKLKTQKEEGRSRKSKLIKNKLFRSQVFKKAKRIMFYISFGGEVGTKDMIKEAQKLGKIISVPVCKKNRTIKPCRLGSATTLAKGLYGICEPTLKRFVNLRNLDLVVVPGVAFDKKGNRLGRGKGYYDSFLRMLSDRATSVGLAFDFQILPAIPTTKRDTKVHRVISN